MPITRIFVPKAISHLVDGRQLPSTEWYTYLSALNVNDESLQADIDALAARIVALEGDVTFIIAGPNSVAVNGTPAGGVVSISLVNDVLSPGNTYYYGTGPTGVKGWFAVADAFTSGDGIDLVTGSDGVTEISFNADTGEVAHLPGATYKTVQKFIDTMISPGIITGGEVTALTSTSVRIAAGTALVRIADDNVSELQFLNFAQQDFSVPDVQVTHFYALDYNGGSPVIIESTTSENWNRDTEIPLGSAVRADGFLNVTPNPYRTGDVITNLIQRLDAIGPVQRDNSVGGLSIGETGTRNVTVSAGRLWSRVSDFTVLSKNSSVDTMASVFFNGTNLTVTSGITQWDNLNFNNLGTGLLQVLGNNKYANLWFFMSFDGTKYGFAYGTNEYNTLGDAANEGVPSYLTQNFFNQFLLLGRFVFQKSAATASIIESAFVTPFSSSAINTHNNLGGLQGGTAGEFYHLTSAQNTEVANALSTGGGFVTIAGAQTITGLKTFTSTIELTDTTATAFNGRNTGTISLGTAITSFSGGDATTLSGIMTLRATEAWTGSAKGTRVQFRATQNTTTTLSEVATMDFQGFGVGTTTPNYAGFVKGITVEGTNCVFEMASARPDASGVLLGAFSGNFRTNSVGHQRIADVQFTTDGPTANQRGGEIGIYTKPDASTTMTKRWSVGQVGHFLPATDNTYDVGSASFRVRQYFGAIGTINTSDERTKTVIGQLTTQELSAAADLAREVIAYKINDAIEAKGDDARIHVGWLAQRVRDIMAKHGLDGFRYGFLCYDEWDEQPERWNDFEATEEVWGLSEEVPEERDEEGNVTQEYVPPERVRLLRNAEPARRELVSVYRPAGSLYGLRKDELFAFIIASQEQRLQALESLLIP